MSAISALLWRARTDMLLGTGVNGVGSWPIPEQAFPSDNFSAAIAVSLPAAASLRKFRKRRLLVAYLRLPLGVEQTSAQA